ncbi:MAG TPA: ATP synthase F1 subunit delta [Bacteroidales bacterium]|nr:ATP synthase F1 subunit delta [Bacteroidales bacterium]
MNQSKISVRYAKAIFEAAGEKNVQKEVFTDFVLISEAISENVEFYEVISSPIIKPSEKSLLLTNVFKSSINSLTMKFLEMIVNNSREKYIIDIARVYSDLYRKGHNVKEVVLTTPYGIDDNTKESLIKTVSESFNSGVEIKEKIKSEMIGGVIIRIDNMQLDLSVATQLKEIRKSLKTDEYERKL